VLEQDSNIAAGDPARIDALPEDLRAAIGRLMPFAAQAPDDPAHAIPYHLQDYLELVDWSGRAIIEGKRGKIPDDLREPGHPSAGKNSYPNPGSFPIASAAAGR